MARSSSRNSTFTVTKPPYRRRAVQCGTGECRARSGLPGYAVLDVVVDAYHPLVEHMRNRIDELEERVLVDASTETLRELNSIKGQLLELRRAITPQRDAVNKLIRMNSEHIPELLQRWSYPGSLIEMTLVAGGMMYYFWRKRWIGRQPPR